MTEAAERLGVTPRRARALAESGLLSAVRRGRMWLTTAEAADHYRRNAPGRGRPLSQRSAWRRLVELARTGTAADAAEYRVALRARARHGIYRVDDRVLERLGDRPGMRLGGRDALRAAGVAVPAARSARTVDLYATASAAAALVERTGATADPTGRLHLHVVDGELPDLGERAWLLTAWCDLADRDDPAAEAALEALWPGAADQRHLADVRAAGPDGTPDLTALRGFVDWVERHPALCARAIARRPARSGNAALDATVAALAETVADRYGIPRPPWTADVPAADAPLLAAERDGIPAPFADRGLRLPAETFWRR